jgi:hypothetical protein
MRTSEGEEDPRRIGANALKKSECIVDDFEAIRRYLNRLENERARSVSAPAIVVEESKSTRRTSISQLWISGKI